MLLDLVDGTPGEELADAEPRSREELAYPISEETVALMQEAIDRGDGVYAIDPQAGRMERVITFPHAQSRPPVIHAPPRRRTPASQGNGARGGARQPSRDGPGSSSDSDEPPLRVVPLARFRRDVGAWLEAVGQ